MEEKVFIFDRHAHQMNRLRQQRQGEGRDFLIQEINQRLNERLEEVNRPFKTVLDMTGSRAKLSIEADKIIRSDCLPSSNIDLVLEEDFLPRDLEEYDLIYHGFGLHFVNDLPGALIQIKKHLAPEGAFFAALLGGETLYELRQCLVEAEIALKGGVSPRISPMVSTQDMAALMQRAGFSLPVIDSDLITVTYRNLTSLLHDLRYMGEGNVIAKRSKAFAPRKLFEMAEELYHQKFSSEGLLQASFRVIYVMGWSS